METVVLLVEFCDEQLALGSNRRTKFQLDGFADLGAKVFESGGSSSSLAYQSQRFVKQGQGCDCKRLQRRIRTNARETQNKE
jgi:hypothetical protein